MAGRLSSAHTVGRRGGTGGRLSDAVRGVGDHRSRRRARQRTAAAARAPARATLRAGASLALWPAVAIVVFTLNSRWVVGDVVRHRRLLRAGERRRDRAILPRPGGRSMRACDSCPVAPWCGPATQGGGRVVGCRYPLDATRASLALLLALAAAAALPMVGLPPGSSVSHQIRPAAGDRRCRARCGRDQRGASTNSADRGAVAAASVVVREATPLDRNAPLVRESQREAAAHGGAPRGHRVSSEHYDGTTIMMSMGSLGHYMHDLSSIGFDIKDFLHEGNGKTMGIRDARPGRARRLDRHRGTGRRWRRARVTPRSETGG